jgi:glycosidase
MTNDFVPQWAKSAIWYQIFPERFRNGNPACNPTKDMLRGSWLHNPALKWEAHPWNADWYRLQPYEQTNRRTVWFNIQHRRFGGDLQGIMGRLDYLQDLGVTAIYLNPVFQSPSSHKYDAATQTHIDPSFGPDPEGDIKIIAAETPEDPATWSWTAADKMMLQLIKEIHRRGMRVIFDGVFNHIGVTSRIFEDVKKNQRDSKYQDWFEIKSWDDAAAGTKFDYKCWFNAREVPEWKRDEKYGLAAGPRKYIFDITRRWLAPDGDVSAGIDGWRLDVAFCVDHAFWKIWRKHVKSINPDAYITGEVLDTPQKTSLYFQGDEFDAEMNYNFAFAAFEYFFPGEGHISSARFDALLRELRDAYPQYATQAMQNLLGSHDTARLSSRIFNAGSKSMRDWRPYYEFSKGINPSFKTQKPDAASFEIQKLLAVFQMTYIGAPMIYYGDEAGMWGANDPDCRKPMMWNDIVFEDERTMPDQTEAAHANPVKFDQEMFAHYKNLIALRKKLAPLALGNYKTLMADDKSDIFIFERSYAGESVIVALNRGNCGHDISLPRAKPLHDALNGEKVITPAAGNIFIKIPPHGACILH